MPVWGRMAMTVIMTPVELLGKFTKPFALAIRLFANMTAGHVMVLALISIVFMFGSVLIGVLPVAMAVGIMVLELFVAFLQAYVFTLLVSSFIGQIRTAEHH
jgi:F-type H+-transporting ATPase subunit a